MFDGQGLRFEATLSVADARQARVVVGPERAPLPESPLRITLAQCVSGAQKMDWTIEKAVELGVAAIQPLLSARSIVRLDAARARRRDEHWQRLIVAACMQCGRDRLPTLEPAIGLNDWLARRDPRHSAITLSPDARTTLSRLEPPGDSVDLLVGPESGLDADELRAAAGAGFTAVSMGPRVLRTETAGLAAIAVLQARFGDF